MGQARCEYRVVNESARSFVANITITNTGPAAIQGWAVNWRYQANSWLTYANGAYVSGRNPYSAVSYNNNAQLQPGQRVNFTVYGTKPWRTSAETPRINGNICR